MLCVGAYFATKYKTNVDNPRENKRAAQKSGLKCVDRKLSCLAVCQPTRSLIGVAMAEGICVEWVSNSSVLAEVVYSASPLACVAAAAAAAGLTEILRIWACIITAAQLFHFQCCFINQH